jgi:hypothetical protein
VTIFILSRQYYQALLRIFRFSNPATVTVVSLTISAG